MKRAATLCVVAATFTVAACSGASDAATTTARSTEPPPTTAAPPVPTIGSPATTTTTTTKTSTTTASTSPAPTTTIDPLADIAAAIQQALTDGEDAIFKAFGDPGSDEAENLLKQFFVGEPLDRLLEALDTLRTEDLIGRRNPEVPQVVILQSAPQLIGSGLVEATVCRVDAGLVLEVSDAGEEVVVNDTIRRIVAMSEFVLEDNQWKLSNGRTISDTLGATSCDE